MAWLSLLGVLSWGEEGQDRFELFTFAEADLDLPAPPQRPDPDGEFEGLAHEPGGFVELARRPAVLVWPRLARRLAAGEVVAHQLFGSADGELLGLYPPGEFDHLLL